MSKYEEFTTKMYEFSNDIFFDTILYEFLEYIENNYDTEDINIDDTLFEKIKEETNNIVNSDFFNEALNTEIQESCDRLGLE